MCDGYLVFNREKILHVSMKDFLLFFGGERGIGLAPLPQTHALNLLWIEPRPTLLVRTPLTQKILHVSMKDFYAESEGFEPPNL